MVDCRRAVVGLTVLAFVSRAVVAQVSSQVRDSLAYLYAPRFHFSPSEGFFPTTPFEYAFDGLDNDGDSATRHDGMGEIAPLDSVFHTIDHRILMGWYRERVEPNRARQARRRDSLSDLAAKLALKVSLNRVGSLASAFRRFKPRVPVEPAQECAWDSSDLQYHDSVRTTRTIDPQKRSIVIRAHESLQRSIACFRRLPARITLLNNYETSLKDSTGALIEHLGRLAQSSEFLVSQAPAALINSTGQYQVASRIAQDVADLAEESDPVEAERYQMATLGTLLRSSTTVDKLLREVNNRVCTMEHILAVDSGQVRCKVLSLRGPVNSETRVILETLAALIDTVEGEVNPEVDEAVFALIDTLGLAARTLAAEQGPYPPNAESVLRQLQREINQLTTDIGRFLRPPPNATIFYAVSVLNYEGVEDLWRMLRLDGQAWRRLQLDRYEVQWREPRTTHDFYVIEYYLYYLNDVGLEGHPHDLEKVFVFVPAAAGLADSIRILAGAGHSPSTPNNVLILTYPATLIETEPNFLVEYGGHSNAPDRLPYKTFQRGWDVNWNAGDFIWGTRDLQAVTGTGFLEDYDMGLTLPRHDTLSVMLSLAKPSARKAPESSGNYTLIPVDHFLKFVRSISVVSDTLELTRLPQFGSTPRICDSVSECQKVWRSAKYWLRPTTVSDTRQMPARHHLPWMDQQRRLNQLAIFKPYLYPPRPGVSGLLSAIVVNTEPSKGSIKLGLSLSSSSLFGAGPMIPGMIQPELLGVNGLFNSDPTRAVLGFRYERYYTAIVSWYLGMHWHLLDRPREPDPIVATGGLSFMPLLLLTHKHDPAPATVFAGTIRFRLGVQLNMRTRAEHPVAPHFEIEFRPPHSSAKLRSSINSAPVSRAIPGPRH